MLQLWKIDQPNSKLYARERHASAGKCSRVIVKAPIFYEKHKVQCSQQLQKGFKSILTLRITYNLCISKIDLNFIQGIQKYTRFSLCDSHAKT
jgi:hypothetical protein